MGTLGTAFVDIRARMENLAGDLQDAESRVSQRMKAISDKMNTVGESMSKAITLPFAALGAVLFKTQSDAAASIGQIQAGLGVTNEEAKKLAGTAQEVWKKGFGENLQEVNQAVITVKQGMAGLNEEDLQNTTTGAMTLAQVMGEDVGAVVRGADGLMQTFGLSSQEALDLLTVGTQKGANESQDLLDTVREYGPMFNQLGFSAEDMMATLVAGSNNAAFTTDKLADAFKEFSLRVVDGSKSTSEAMQGLGLDADAMAQAIAKGGPEAAKANDTIISSLAAVKDPVEQERIGIALFGSQWEDLGGSVLLASAQTENGLGKIKGANAEAQAAINAGNPMKALQIAGRELASAIGPIMEPFINVIVTKVVPAVQAFSDKFAALPQPIKNTIGIVGALVAGIAPLLIGLSKVIGIIQTLAPLLGTLKTAFTAVRTAIMFMGGPITIVVGLIVGLIAIFVKLYKENETFRNVVNNVWSSIKTFFTATVTAIKDAFVTAWNAIRDTAAAVWEAVSTATSAVWNGIKAALEAIWNGIKAAVEFYFNAWKTIITTIWNAIKTVTETVWNGIKAALDFVFEAIKTAVTFYFNLWKTIITTVWNAIKTVTETVWNAISTALSAVFDFMKNTITTVWNAIKTTTETVWNAIKTALTAVFDFLKNAITTAWNAYKTLVTNNWNAIKSATEAVWNAIKTALTTVWNFLKSTITNTWNAIKTVTTTVWNAVKSYLTSLFNTIKAAVSTAWNAFKSVITSGWNAIKSTTTAVWNSIKTFITNTWNNIKSTASSVWNGLKSTLSGAWNSIKSTATSVFNSIKSTVTNVWNGLKNTVVNAANRIRDGVKSAFTNVKNSMNGIWSGVVSGIKAALNSGLRAVNRVISGINAIIRKVNQVPKVNIPTLPNVPLLARGGNILADGLAIVGENGPEMLELPRGARVSPLGGNKGAQGTGAGTVQLIQNMEVKATPEELQQYVERGLRKVIQSAGLLL